MRNSTLRDVDDETAGTMRLLGFVAEEIRIWSHAALPEAGRFDATAAGDDHVLPQAVAWMHEAAAARGRARLRADLKEILG